MARYPTGEVIARSLLAAAAVATFAACGAQSSGSAVSGGLYGTVRVSPATPVCGTSCSIPAKNFKLTFAGRGHTVTVTTDLHGHYRVKLVGGRYLVRAPGRTTLPRRAITPAVVTVPSGRFAHRDFVYDSGIR
jgi:anaerobic selenocysteine-containing dehydrogenase